MEVKALVSSESLTEGRSTSKLTLMVVGRIHFLAGCGWDLSIRQLVTSAGQDGRVSL